MIIELGLASDTTRGGGPAVDIEFTSPNSPLTPCPHQFTGTPGGKFTCS